MRLLFHRLCIMTEDRNRKGSGHGGREWDHISTIVTRPNPISQNEVPRFHMVIQLIRQLRGKVLGDPIQRNILQITPFETANRYLRRIWDYARYKEIHLQSLRPS